MTFEKSDDAIAAKHDLDMSLFDGRRISVTFSKRCKPREPTPGKYLGSKRNRVDPHLNPEDSSRRMSPSRQKHRRSRSRDGDRFRSYHDRREDRGFRTSKDRRPDHYRRDREYKSMGRGQRYRRSPSH